MKKMMISVLGAGLAALFLAGCSGNGNTQTAGSAETGKPEKPASTGAGTYIVSNMEDLLALKPAEAKAIVMMKGYYSYQIRHHHTPPAAPNILFYQKFLGFSNPSFKKGLSGSGQRPASLLHPAEPAFS